MSLITVYSRAGCHLCEEAETIVRRLARPQDTVEIVDVDSSPDLAEAYTVLVPVVTIDGVEVAQLQVDETALRYSLPT